MMEDSVWISRITCKVKYNRVKYVSTEVADFVRDLLLVAKKHINAYCHSSDAEQAHNPMYHCSCGSFPLSRFILHYLSRSLRVRYSKLLRKRDVVSRIGLTFAYFFLIF